MKKGIEYVGSTEHRAFDLIGSFLLAIPSVPVAAAAALTIRTELQGAGPIIHQQRVGMYDTTFDLLKLRTFFDQLSDGSNDIGGSDHPSASPRAQLPEVLEQRASADRALFNDWHWWYERNIGILGEGQAYAHGFGTYKENSTMVCEVMRLDIAGCETASIATQAAHIASLVPVVGKALPQILLGSTK